MGLFKDYVSQTRKPQGRLGKMMLNGMNSGHAKMADWAISHLQTVVPERVVDLGCGKDTEGRWVGHTKAWVIPGTEDLMPYIYGKTLVKKWLGTIVGFPILAAILAGIMQLIL